MAKNGTLHARIVNTHDVESNWNKTYNFIPRSGEVIVYDPDSTHATARLKVGDGVHTIQDLPFILNATIHEELSEFFGSTSASDVVYLNGGNISTYNNEGSA